MTPTEKQVAETAPRGFSGFRVVSFESRLADECKALIRKAGGIAISAPSMREIPLEDNSEARSFATRLVEDGYDIVVFTTGVGTRTLFEAMETAYPRSDLITALARTTVVARGPKPHRVLRELGVPVAIAVPEPNTWREVVAAIEESAEGVSLDGARVAVQEYGARNQRFLDELAERGARVDPVPVYRWALPENLGPMRDAIGEIIARTADVVLFTSATQVQHVFEVASCDGNAADLRRALEEVAVCSIGPVCSEALTAAGIRVDLEPSRPKLGVLVGEAAARATDLVSAKRSAHRPVTSIASRKPPPADILADELDASPFMRACRRQPTDVTPVWLMRQAGRYMQEYREMRARVPFIELCKNPDLCAEATVVAQERIGVDAAIIFSDILLIVEPMGLGLEYVRGEGPSISHVVRRAEDVARLREVDPHESLPFVFEAVRKTRAALAPNIPLIGFSGAPFTLASYIIEGGGSRNYVATKTLMYRDKGAWDAVLSLIARAVAAYLRGQIEAGCQAVQLFDSWVGCLSPADYETYVLPHTRAVVEALPPEVPVIHFGTETATLLDLQVQAGAHVIGVDHRVPIGPVFDRFPNVAVQGNLDPVVLFADREYLRRACRRLLDEVGGRPGHIFNLGHGVLPATPVDNVIALVDAVHEYRPSSQGSS